MKSLVYLSVGIFLFLSTVSSISRADIISDLFDEPDQKKGEVIVERPVDLTANYKQRRQRHGLLFSVNQEKFYPSKYYSQYQDMGVADLIGSSNVNLLGAELGYKFNFQLGSGAILAGYAQGNSDAPGIKNIWIKRTTLSANFALDNFFDEPWVVPYIQGGLSNFSVEEGRTGSDYKNASASSVPSYKFGLLFQLNWIENAIDPSSNTDALRSSGLENTFLDVYYIGHLETANSMDPTDPNFAGEPNMRSSDEMGIGLKMEF